MDGDLTLLDRSVFERMWQAVDRGPRFPHGASMATVGRIKRDWFKKNEAQGCRTETQRIAIPCVRRDDRRR